MRLRLRSLLAAAILTAAAVPGAPAAESPAPRKELVRMGGAPEIPDSPEGRRARGWLRAFNTGNADSMAAFYRDHLAASSRDRPPIQERLANFRRLSDEMGRLDLMRVVEDTPGEIGLRVRTKSGEVVDVVVHVEAEEPHQLLGIRLMQTAGDPGPEPEPDADRGPLSEAGLRDSLRASLARLAAAERFSGVVLVKRGDRVLYHQAVGFADREKKIPNLPDTRFNIGSINKTFTRLAIQRLADAGQLQLSDPVSKHLPDFPRDKGDRITIAQLLQMQGGLAELFAKWGTVDHSKMRDPRDWFPLFVNEPLLFEPGTDRRYSNSGYVVLGAIIEAVTGRGYYDVIRELVYRPAGMKDSDSFPLDDALNRATGYTRGDPRRPPGSQPDAPLRPNVGVLPWRGSPAGGGYATAPDLVRFAEALRDGKLSSRNEDGLGDAGGAPGLNAALELEGRDIIVVLSNFDPPSAESLSARIRRWMRRLT